MNTINAKKARQLMDDRNNEELLEVLNGIEEEAVRNYSTSYIYKPLSNSTIEELKKRGFSVEAQPSIAIQKDSLYYTINW